MRFTTAALAATASLVSAQSPPLSDYSASDIASGAAFYDINDIAIDNVRWNITNRPNQECQFEDAVVRKEWHQMSQDDRKSFTDAATCLMNHAPTRITPEQADLYPGVKSRWDEYVVTHINLTERIHVTADFLAWHRYFVHSLEVDLREMCGYRSYMPYWNWARHAQAPQDNPMFNGDEYSLGSNGAFVAGREDTYLGLMDITFPPGTGGGCVTDGPFADITVNMGPIDSPYGDNVENKFDYNPRCLSRDLNSFFSSNYLTFANITELLLENVMIEDFQNIMQGYGSENNDNPVGIHGGGHWATGAGTPMGDFHASPSDPLFFLHHAMVDRVWGIWQGLDIYRRQAAISGTSTLGNDPPSDPMTLDDMLPFGLVGDDVRFGDVMDTFKGPYCYRYD